MFLPNLDGVVEGFKAEMAGMRSDLAAIREALDKLVELEEGKQ